MRFELRSTALAPEVIKQKHLFHGDGFSLIIFFIICRHTYEKGNATIVFRSRRFGKLTLKDQSDLRLGQVKVRSWPKYVNMHIFRSGLTSQVVWHHLCVSIFILSRVIGEKRIVTSCDLIWPSRHQLHPDHHRWDEWLWSWKNRVVSVGLCETGSIFIFPRRLI